MIVVDVKYLPQMGKMDAEKLVEGVLAFFRAGFQHIPSIGDYRQFKYSDDEQPNFFIQVNIAESTIGDLQRIADQLINLASLVVPGANIVLLLQGGRGVVSHTRKTDNSRVAGQ